MLDAAGLEKWIAENGTGHKENKHFNGIDYLFVTMNDGWIAVFECADGYYIPCLLYTSPSPRDTR